MANKQNQKTENGNRKANRQLSKQEIKEIEDFLYDKKPSAIAELLELIKLLFILTFKLINPTSWKKLYRYSYHTWLKSRKRYEKLLELWSTHAPETTLGEVIKSLEMTDCYIQLGRYTEGVNCLKGLSEKIDASDRDNEWKKEKHNQVKLYRNTIHDLAKLRFQKAEE